MTNHELTRLARRRAGAKFGFLIHLTVFVAVNLILIAINLQATPTHRWFAFPLGGWAIGLAIHGLAVFLNGTGLREMMVASELRKLAAQRGTDAGQARKPGV